MDRYPYLKYTILLDERILARLGHLHSLLHIHKKTQSCNAYQISRQQGNNQEILGMLKRMDEGMKERENQLRQELKERDIFLDRELRKRDQFFDEMIR